MTGPAPRRSFGAGCVLDSQTTLILNDLVTLALAAENDTFIPDTHHINALPGAS